MWHSYISRVTNILLFHKRQKKRKREYVPVLFPSKYKLHKLSSYFPRKAVAGAWSSHFRFSVKIPILSVSTILRFKHFGGFMGLQGKNLKSDSLYLFYTYALTLWYQCMGAAIFMISISGEINKKNNKILLRKQQTAYWFLFLS